MPQSTDDARGPGRGTPLPTKRLTPRPRAQSWSPPAKRVTLPSRDPRKGRGR